MPNKTQSILLGGLVVGILSTSYLSFINLLCCAGVIIGGLVAVWHYTSENDLTIPAGQGAAIGALAGVVGALIGAALNWVVGVVGLPDSQEVSQTIQSLITGSGAQDMSPEQEEQMRAMQERFSSPMFMIIGIGVSMAVSAVFGAIGGAIGAAVFKKGGDEAVEI